MDAMTDVQKRLDGLVKALDFQFGSPGSWQDWNDAKARHGVGLSPAAADAAQGGKERHFCLAGCNPRNGRWRFGTPTGDWCDVGPDTIPAGISLESVLSEVAEKRMVELDPRTGHPLAPPPAPAWPRWFTSKGRGHQNGTDFTWRMASPTEGRYWSNGRDGGASILAVSTLETDHSIIELTPATCPALAEARRAATEQPRDAMEERAMAAWSTPEYQGVAAPVAMVKFARAERVRYAATIAAMTEERDGLREKVAGLTIERDGLIAGKLSVRVSPSILRGKLSYPQIKLVKSPAAKEKSPRRGGAKKARVRK